jgi:hypothetical protein
MASQREEELMTPEIRRKALSTAAKAAMAMSLGCAPEPPHVTSTPTATSDPAKPSAGESCDAYLAELRVLKFDDLTQAERDASVLEAFADVPARKSPRTAACCAEELGRDGANAKRRFACCSALGNQVPAAVIHAGACTPWGPPWPPEMA